ncbi:MAG TPA: 16S rRNA (adenine(1518)-N(6)/adenine(1519)-N(6))-dimethyltransferase RsmA [Polyangiaceae bacterium]|nr:16S rRNA (adenine(1518)-N(6)/adenine(1519)-N(6))-dimethyltransferase RsmA [Polyangiaceae bacterium]
MPELPPSPKTQLSLRGLTPKRHFGQNFLADAGLSARIAELALPDGGSALELGAGLGALTRPLLARAEHVIAVERDRDLVPALQEDFAAEIAAGRLQVLEADAKSIAPGELLGALPRPRVLCGNLPYQITGPLLELAVHSASGLDRAVFLVQLEVANRLSAAPASADYGALSVFTQAAFAVSRALVVRRGAFYPQPGVDSAVVVLTPHAVPTPETKTFAAFVKAAFAQRRKQLSNAWRGVGGLSPEQLVEAARAAEIDLSARGETLAVADFARIAEVAERVRS